MIQQTIQEVKFEEIILAKKQRQARKTNKIRHWLQYFNMLDQNHAFNKKNQTIKELHHKFIFREDFWVREVKRLLNDQKSINPEGFQLAFIALEDGFYINVAQLIAQKLVEAHNAQKLRLNFVIAKLEILISQFDHCTKDGSVFFEALLKVYLKTNNVKKIRQTYRRQIAMSFDDYDVAYAKYLKWEESQGNIESNDHKELLQKARNYWQQTQIFNEEQMSALQKCSEFVPSQQIKTDKRNIKRCLVHLQDLNSVRVDQKKYLTLLNLLDTNTQKLWYLRRMALQQTHQMVEKYFETLELSGAQDDQVIRVFKNSFEWSFNQVHLQLYESLYLSYLIRRINKHLTKSQDEEYNNSWGGNVQFFRNQVAELISKQRTNLGQQKQLLTKYYYLWIEVETSLVKDVATVQQIFDNLLEWGQIESIYIEYAKCMVRLGDITKARSIIMKTCEAQNYQGQIVKQYQSFLQIYGSLDEIIKLKEKVSAKAQQRLQLEAKKLLPIFHPHQSSEARPTQKQVQQKKGQTKSTNQDHQNLLSSSPLHLYPQNEEQPEKQEKVNGGHNFKRSLPTQQTLNEDERQNHHQKKKVHLDQQNTLFSQNVQKDWGEAEIMLNIVFKQCVNEVRIVNKPKGRFCYIEFDSQENAQKEMKANKSPLKLAFSRPPSKSDNCTLFLCNLPLNVPKDQIKELIPQIFRENVKDIRTKEKGDKNTAYIEFKDETSKDQALSLLKKQKIKIRDRTIIALSCESDFRNKDKKYKTIFLKNLSFKCKQKDIKGFFEKKGFQSIIEVFIPKDDKTNRSKGFAYVEFLESEEVQTAITLQKGDLHGRQFVITKSDRAITHQDNRKEQRKPEKEEKPKPKPQVDPGKSNNFFSNFFS